MKKIINSIIIVLLIATAVYGADIKKNIAKCASIEDDVSRIACFDDLAEKLGVNKPIIKTTVGSGKWEMRQEQSQIDDSTNICIALVAENIVHSGYKTVQPVLYLRCAENKTTVFISWDLFLGSDDTDVLTRFDKQKAITKSWLVSTDHTAIFVRGGDIAFIKEIMKHDKLLVQLTPYGENPIMTTFDIRGLSETIAPLQKACNW